jgi:COP9 signalosome complex subunit 1
MAHRDLADFYRSLGEHSSALKHYTKSREFCTTSQHVLDMCMSVIEVCTLLFLLFPQVYGCLTTLYLHSQLLIEQRNYSHLVTYVFKADAALDAASATASASANNGPTPAAGSSNNSKKKSSERESVQSKLDLATALSHLGQANYQKAAYYFLRLGPARELGDWVGKVWLRPWSYLFLTVISRSGGCTK